MSLASTVAPARRSRTCCAAAAGLPSPVQASRPTPGSRTIAGRPRSAPLRCSTASSSALPMPSSGTGPVPISAGVESVMANRTPGHRALADLETAGLAGVITQNVDGLHAAAGSRRRDQLAWRYRHASSAWTAVIAPRAASCSTGWRVRIRSSTSRRVLEHAELRPDGDAVARDWQQFGWSAVCTAAGGSSPMWCSSASRCRKTRVEAAYALVERARGLGGLGLVADGDVGIAFRPAPGEASATGRDHQSRSDSGRRARQP